MLMNIRIRILLGRHYLHQQEADNEGAALAVADLPVVDAVGLHHVEQRLLAHAALLLEEVVLGVGAGDVAPDHLLARALGPQQRRVARLVLGGVRPAQNLQSGGRVLALVSTRYSTICLLAITLRTISYLPGHAAEVMRDALPHQLLQHHSLDTSLAARAG